MRRPAGIEDVGIRPVSGKWADGCDEGSGRQARPACVEWLNWHDSGSVVGEVEDPLSKVGPWCVCEATSQSLNSLVVITLPELFVDDKRLCLLIDIFSTQDKASKRRSPTANPKVRNLRLGKLWPSMISAAQSRSSCRRARSSI